MRKLVGSNARAAAFAEASEDLGFRFVTPFRFKGKDGRSYQCTGWIPFVGAPAGMLVIDASDPDLDRLLTAANELPFLTPGLSPRYYDKYNRSRFLAMFEDLGWYGPEGQRPPLFPSRVSGNGA
jgi:hypothetical protein